MSGRQRMKRRVNKLRKAKKNLKERVSQSMSDSGSRNVTGKCKSLQKKLANVVKAEKKVKKRLRRK